MESNKGFRLAIQGIAAVLLFGIAFAANADVMKALPAPSVANSPSPNATIALPQTKKSGGVMQLSPDAACAVNNTPRISSINGRSSAGIVFKPGDALNIAGCGFGGFGKGAQASLYNVGGLIIDGWEDSNIHAHIDPALRGVPDSRGSVKLFVTPYGVPALVSAGHSFTAAREDVQVALPQALGIYSQFFGVPNVSESGNFTIVARDFTVTKPTYCPGPSTESQMQDVWQIDSKSILRFFKPGFEVVGANYQNLTDQRDNFTDEDHRNRYDSGVIGNSGKAELDKAQNRVTVTFQGHSTYGKIYLGQPDNFDGPAPGNSQCTSRYSVSLIVSGPRGISPLLR